jgi:hypothetical protein
MRRKHDRHGVLARPAEDACPHLDDERHRREIVGQQQDFLQAGRPARGSG